MNASNETTDIDTDLTHTDYSIDEGFEGIDDINSFLEGVDNDIDSIDDSDLFSVESLNEFGIKEDSKTEFGSELYEIFTNKNYRDSFSSETLFSMANQLTQDGVQLTQNSMYALEGLNLRDTHNQELIEQGIALTSEEAYYESSHYISLEADSGGKKANAFSRMFSAILEAFRRFGQALMAKITAIGNLIRSGAIKGQAKFWNDNKEKIKKNWNKASTDDTKSIVSRKYLKVVPVKSIEQYQSFINEVSSNLQPATAGFDKALTEVHSNENIKSPKVKSIVNNLNGTVTDSLNGIVDTGLFKSIFLAFTSKASKANRIDRNLVVFGKIVSHIAKKEHGTRIFIGSNVEENLIKRARKIGDAFDGPNGDVILGGKESFNAIRVALKTAAQKVKRNSTIAKKISGKAVGIARRMGRTNYKNDPELNIYHKQVVNGAVKYFQLLTRQASAYAVVGTYVLTEYLDYRRSFMAACKATLKTAA